MQEEEEKQENRPEHPQGQAPAQQYHDHDMNQLEHLPIEADEQEGAQQRPLQALIVNNGNYPVMVDLPGDDEAMVELAIALSLQDQVCYFYVNNLSLSNMPVITKIGIIPKNSFQLALSV